jgi:hypothetical protein
VKLNADGGSKGKTTAAHLRAWSVHAESSRAMQIGEAKQYKKKLSCNVTGLPPNSLEQANQNGVCMQRNLVYTLPPLYKLGKISHHRPLRRKMGSATRHYQHVHHFILNSNN